MKLSIITINYNNREGLDRTFQSVFSQTEKEFEYIVIDGGSTDGSKQLIELNQDKINYWVSESDKGIYNAMNKGIRASKGEYLLFLNSGDKLFNDEVLKLILNNLNGEDIISGNLEIIDQFNKSQKWFSPVNISFSFFIKQTICHPCTFINKNAFIKYGLYDENLKIVSDWKWFLNAFYKYDAIYKKLDFFVSTFYMDGISSSNNSIGLIVNERNLVLNEYKYFEEFNQLLQKTEHYSRILRNSRWIRIGKKLGFLKDLD